MLLGVGMLVGIGSAHAQALPSLLPGAAAPASAAASAPPLSAEELAALVAGAQEQVQRLDATAASQPDAPLLAARRQAAERLLALLQMRQQRAGAPTPQQGAGTPADPIELPPGLTGAPPYSALAVDALRDQRDGLLGQRRALQVSLEAIDQQNGERLQAQRKASERTRLSQERVDATATNTDGTEARAALELEQLQERGAAEELVLLGMERTQQRQRLSRLEAPLDELNASLARLTASQKLDDADLAEVRRRAEPQQQWIVQERRRLVSRMGGRRSAASNDAASALVREADTLQLAMRFLADLELVERDDLAYWQLRQAAYAASASGTSLAPLKAQLAQAGERIAARRRVVDDRLELLLSTEQLQRTRLAALAAGDAGHADEQAVLAAQEAAAEALRRVRDGLTRSATVIARASEDLGAAVRPADAKGWLRLTTESLTEVFDRVWQFELFSATEQVEVDGRVVEVGRPITVGKSIGVLVLFSLGYLLAARLAAWCTGLMVRRLNISVQLARVLRRWILSILMLVVLLAVLRLVHIPLTAFAFLGGALAIGVGLGAQSVLKNLISGLIILFERKIRVGDIVTLGGVSGTVTAVDLRASTLRGFDGIDLIVPNSALLENQVSNWHLASTAVRREVCVDIPADIDIRNAMARVLECAREHPSTIAVPAPEVLLAALGRKAMQLRLQYWISLQGPLAAPTVDSQIRLAIHDALALPTCRTSTPELRRPTD